MTLENWDMHPFCVVWKCILFCSSFFFELRSWTNISSLHLSLFFFLSSWCVRVAFVMMMMMRKEEEERTEKTKQNMKLQLLLANIMNANNKYIKWREGWMGCNKKKKNRTKSSQIGTTQLCNWIYRKWWINPVGTFVRRMHVCTRNVLYICIYCNFSYSFHRFWLGFFLLRRIIICCRAFFAMHIQNSLISLICFFILTNIYFGEVCFVFHSSRILYLVPELLLWLCESILRSKKEKNEKQNAYEALGG